MPSACDTAPLSATAFATTARAWLAVASIAFGTFALVTTEFLPIGLLTAIAADLHVSEGRAGLMVTVPGIIAALAAPLLTLAAGRLDRRYVLWSLTFAIATSNLIVAAATGFTAILAARILLGFGVGGFWAFAAGLGIRLVPEASAGRATAIILAGISVGTVLGVPTGALIGALVGWRSAFLVTGLFALGVLALQMLLLPRLPVAQAIRPTILLQIFHIPAARIGLVATVLLIVGHFAAYTYLRPLLEHLPGIDARLITLLLLVYGGSGFLGTFIGEAAIRHSLAATLASAALVITAVLLVAPFATANGFWAGLIIVAIWGTAFGVVPIALQTWMMRAAPDAMEGGLALFVSIFQIALGLGAALGGLAMDGFGIAGPMIMGGLLAMAMAGFIAVTHRRND